MRRNPRALLLLACWPLLTALTPAECERLERAHRLRSTFRCDLGLGLYERVIARASELDERATRRVFVDRFHGVGTARPGFAARHL